MLEPIRHHHRGGAAQDEKRRAEEERDRAEWLRYSGEIGKWFHNTTTEGVRVMGPAAAPIVRLKRDYRYHFVLKAQSREKLNAVLRAMLRYAAEQNIPRTNVIVDVDALSMM